MLAIGLAGPAAAQGIGPTFIDGPGAMSSGDWSGVYAGLDLGLALSNGRAERSAASGIIIETDVRNGLFPSSIAEREASYVAGAVIGHDVQWGRFVGGLALGIAALDQDTTLSFAATDPEIIVGALTSTTYRTEIDRMATLRLRAGLAQGDTLYYASAGLAAAEMRNSFGLAIDTVAYDSVFVEDRTRHGYIAGLGIERRLSDSISVKAEVSYYNLADATVEARDPTVFPGQVLDYDFRNEGALATIGVNFRF